MFEKIIKKLLLMCYMLKKWIYVPRTFQKQINCEKNHEDCQKDDIMLQ